MKKNLWGFFTECLAKNTGTGKCSSPRRGRFCGKHWVQYRRGIIDKNGRPLRKKRPMHPPVKYHGCVAANSGSGKCGKYTNGRFCGTHWAQYRRGIIDINGNKLRELFVLKNNKECLAKNAGTGSCSKFIGGRFCKRHQNQYEKGIIDINGKKIRDFLPHKGPAVRFKECLAKNAGTGKCTKNRDGRFCSLHKSQYAAGIIDWDGKKLRDKIRSEPPHKVHFTKCLGGIGSCSRYINGRFCAKHRGQYYRGEIDENGKVLRPRVCGIPECGEQLGGPNQWGLCRFHYDEIIRKEKYEDYPSLTPTLKSTMPVVDIKWNRRKHV